MPDYQIKKWDEQNSPVHLPYVRKALQKKQWANASNFVRLWAVYGHGGLYFDTDVEVLKPFDDLLNNVCFLGKEKSSEKIYVNNAVIGAVPGHWFIRQCLVALSSRYDGSEAANLSSPMLTTLELKKLGSIKGPGEQVIRDIRLYDHTLFYPYAWNEKERNQIPETHCLAIHHYEKNWSSAPVTQRTSWKKKIRAWLPEKWVLLLKYGLSGYRLIRDKKVAAGPFEGLCFKSVKSHGSSIYPKLTGSYEECLHETLYAFACKKYAVIYNFGAGEGYYAMGLTQLMQPAQKTIAFEPHGPNIDLLRKNIDHNGLAQKVEVREEFADADTINKLPAEGRKFIFCDVEGAENAIFHAGNMHQLKNADLIIELHEFIDREVARYLEAIFSRSHTVKIIQEDQYYRVKLAWMKKSGFFRYRWELFDEHRPVAMRWMCLEAKTG
ncbi:MAG: hypothetical protein IPN29_03695 [Saprospiraceae bacterium]|nr:hypothetical protein [Saprospiraceae bacterium]